MKNQAWLVCCFFFSLYMNPALSYGDGPSQRRPPFFTKLSSDVLVYVSFPNVKATLEKWQENDWRDIANNEQAGNDLRQVARVLENAIDHQLRDYPLSFREMLDGLGGEMSMAIMPNANNSLIWIALADRSSDSLGTDVVFSTLVEKLVTAGGTKREVRHGNGILVQSIHLNPKQKLVYFTSDDALVFSEDEEVVSRVAQDWFASDTADSFALNSEFIAARERARNADFELFVRVDEYAKRMARPTDSSSPFTPWMFLENPIRSVHLSGRISAPDESVRLDLALQTLDPKSLSSLGKSARSFFASQAEFPPYNSPNYTEIHLDVLAILDIWFIQGLTAPFVQGTGDASPVKMITELFSQNLTLGSLGQRGYWFCAPVGTDEKKNRAFMELVSKSAKNHGMELKASRDELVAFTTATSAHNGANSHFEMAFGIAESKLVVAQDGNQWRSLVQGDHDPLSESIPFRKIAEILKEELRSPTTLVASYWDSMQILMDWSQRRADATRFSQLSRSLGIKDWSAILQSTAECIGPAGAVLSIEDGELRLRLFVCNRTRK